MPKFIPQRMCVACREMKDKAELVRIVKNADGDISIDQTFKKNGRGAYICKAQTCLEKCKKTRALNRAFKCEISQEIYEEIKKQI